MLIHRPPPADWPPRPGAAFTFVDTLHRDGVGLEHLDTVQGDRVTHQRYQVTYTLKAEPGQLAV